MIRRMLGIMTNDTKESTTSTAPVIKKTAMYNAPPPSISTSTSGEQEETKPKMAFSGTGNVLSSGAQVVSTTPKPIVSSFTTSMASNDDAKDDEKKVKQGYSLVLGKYSVGLYLNR